MLVSVAVTSVWTPSLGLKTSIWFRRNEARSRENLLICDKCPNCSFKTSPSRNGVHAMQTMMSQPPRRLFILLTCDATDVIAWCARLYFYRGQIAVGYSLGLIIDIKAFISPNIWDKDDFLILLWLKMWTTCVICLCPTRWRSVLSKTLDTWGSNATFPTWCRPFSFWKCD